MSVYCDHCDQKIRFGQTQLTRSEKQRYQWAGPNGSPNIIEAQCVKAAAEYFGVVEWMDYWDPSLSVDENIEIMRTEGDGMTMREIPAQYR